MPKWTHIMTVAAASISLLALSGCGNAAPSQTATPNTSITVTDDSGQAITLKKAATRIVTIEPSNTEIALDLGLKSNLVGIDQQTIQYTPAPWSRQLHGLHNIGASYPSVSLEKIVATKPNLVITANGVKGLSGLKALHIPVMVLNPTSIQGVYHDITLVGKVTGKTPKATRVIQHMKSEVSALESKVAQTKGRPTVFYDLGNLYTAGPGNFLSNLITLAGATNVGSVMSKTTWPQVTAEQVVKTNPNIILIDGSAGETIAQEDKQAGFSAITAVKTHHVLLVPNSSYVSEPSPGLVMGLKELIHLIHPRLKV